MAKSHRYKFWGQNIALIIYSSSVEDPYIFMQWIKRKKDNSWEKPKNKEGRYIKFSLDEIVIILKILKQERYEWSTYHIFNGEKTDILINWEDKTYERLWLKIPEYAKVLESANAEVLQLLLNHILLEKIEYATSYKKIELRENEQVINENINFEDKEHNLSEKLEHNNNINHFNNSKNKINGTIKKETDKAILIILNSGNEKWIPKSTVHNDFLHNQDIVQEFIIDNWVLEKNDINQ
ncbi:MAG: hypothetical protein GF317_17750 [Candidatus Lokiarchaeota archaeon]|nr:hypothetical protein [Candidatus Lokiarchaeota archaeon]MBD3201358.1 hypothetical protein [Candidatus Lokiarchaeota archaeon]